MNDEKETPKTLKNSRHSQIIDEGFTKTFWSSTINEEDQDRAAERENWRRSINSIVDEILTDKRHHQGIHRGVRQSVYALARACTMTNPDHVGRKLTMPERKRWAASVEHENLFSSSLCTAEDRADILRWVGRMVAVSNWHKDGRGAAPMAGAVASQLMMHWAAIAWRERVRPDWCQFEVDETDSLVYAGANATKLFRPWAEIQKDMHIFLKSWNDESTSLGRNRPRKGGRDPDRESEAAKEMREQFFLLRAIEVTYPKTLIAENVSSIKSLDRHINSLKPEGNDILLVLEDRHFLEKGLAQIPEQEITEKEIKGRRKL